MFLDRSSAIFHGSDKETVLTQNPSQGFSVRLFSGVSLCFSRHFTAYCKCLSARKAKQLDATTMFTYSHANTRLGQSERAYYLSYFIINNS